MADTVKVPGISQPLPKWAVLGGLGLTGLAIAVYYRNRKNTAAAAAAAAPSSTGLAAGADTSSAYPWDGTYSNPSDPYSLDTTTGQTYGNEGFLGTGGQNNSSTGQAAGPPFSSNAAWSAYAIQQLTQQSGLDASKVTEAIGLYLNGRGLDGTQQDIVYSAIAVAGPVPVAGPGGYPPKLRAISQTNGGHKGGRQSAENPVRNLRAKPGMSLITVSWDKAAHATGYQVSIRDIGKHTSPRTITTVRTEHTFRDLTAGDPYEITVLAKPAEKGDHAARIQAAPIALLRHSTATRR